MSYVVKATISFKKYKIALKKIEKLNNSKADVKLIKKYKFISKYHFKNFIQYKTKA